MENAVVVEPVDIKTKTMPNVRHMAPDVAILQQTRDTLMDLRARFDLPTVERNIRALQAASRIQGVEKDLQAKCWAELRKYKLIKEILDSDCAL
jgi:hypothetical protein